MNQNKLSLRNSMPEKGWFAYDDDDDDDEID
jgi:hypothetical protein